MLFPHEMTDKVIDAIEHNNIGQLIKFLPKTTVHKDSTVLLNQTIKQNRIYSAFFLIKFGGVHNLAELKRKFDKLKLLLLTIPRDVVGTIFAHLDKNDLINLFMSSKIFHRLFNIPLILYLSSNNYLNEKCLRYIMEDYTGLNMNLLLVYACKYELTDLIKFCLRKGSEIGFRQQEPLTKACYNGNLEHVEILVKAGADFTENGWYPLKTAIYYDKDEIVKYFVDKVMQPNDRVRFMKSLALNIF